MTVISRDRRQQKEPLIFLKIRQKSSVKSLICLKNWIRTNTSENTARNRLKKSFMTIAKPFLNFICATSRKEKTLERKADSLHTLRMFWEKPQKSAILCRYN